MRWAVPGPAAVTVWLLVTVVAPLVSFEFTHLWEEDQDATPAAMWALASTPLVAFLTAVPAARRPGARAVLVLVGATVSGWVLLAVALAGWSWIVPLDGDLDVFAVAAPAAVLSVVGALPGYGVGRLLPAPTRRPVLGYVLGPVVAVVGAVLAPYVLGLGAEDSTATYPFTGGYGGGDEPAVLPAAGRYAILGYDTAPLRPDCRVSGPGVGARRADPVTARPADYEGSADSGVTWVATFAVPEPGSYTVTCGGDWGFTVGDLPRVRGAVGSVIHWPLAVLLLLGALPGLAIVANTVRRRRRDPVPATT
ncbi:hypothetical protein Voc01_071680 [Virgisporangium ochraceum]|uniref:Uncharacterized protein n=2 Tax=Virgisporangium ochraceum TaxID=65505 RepID=A0A8J4EF02_9ACTN|nr:hypothetical protein Voc01_071680 [Virgisporangium ochraceum]